MVRTLGFHCQGLGSVPGWGTSQKSHGVTKKKKKKMKTGRKKERNNIKQIEKYFFLLKITAGFPT